MNDPVETVHRLCPACRKENDADARFCKYCASDLDGLKKPLDGESISSKSTSTNNRVPVLVGSVAVIAICLILFALYLRSNESAQLGSVNNASQSSPNRSSVSSPVQPVSDSTPPSPKVTPPVATANGAPSEEMVAAAVRKAFIKLKNEGTTDSIPGISVVGVQELSGSSSAKADVNLTNATFLRDDMLHGQWEIGPGGVGGKMVYPKQRIRIDSCSAIMKYYTNSRWVLESIDTHSYEFGTIKVNVEM